MVGDERARRSSRLSSALALVEAEDFDAGATELRELLPDLDGRDLLEASLALGRASLWTEKTEDALALAKRSLELVDESGDLEMRGPALALISQVHGQRGNEGDLTRALELGDRALEVWVPGTRAGDLVVHESLHALNNYWVGHYADAVDLGRRGEDGATESLALAALGRSEEAIERSDAAITSAREADSALNTAYALCCSTAVLRDVLDLAEARKRNEEAIELYRRIGFESGVMQGEMDLLYADLAEGDVSSADRAWPALWARLGDATGWERWLAPGRLSVARAEIAIRQERWEASVEAALEAIDVARRIGRVKYDVSARIVMGAAQAELGHALAATAELRKAAGDADRLVHPPTRWRAHAALGRVLRAAGDDEGAAAESRTAGEIARDFVANLVPERGAPLIASTEVQDLLRA
jgi:tetratricopeptide (TPR) repeat protein